MAKYRLGVDIGGTFTDVTLLNEDTGDVRVVKVPTTPKNPAIGALLGLKRALEEEGIEADLLSSLIHATTVVTNTVIEGKGAKVGLIASKGLRDVIEIGRERRVTQYDIFEDRLPPLVPRYLRKTVDERVAYNGAILKELDRNQAEAVVEDLVKLGVDSIAVSLLHSYSNPKHERMIKEIIEDRFPHMLVSLSSSILPEWREYERTSTTVVNAYALPRTRRYLEEMGRGLKEIGFTASFFMMSAAGGLLPVETAAEYPVRILESGPASGALASAFLGKLTGDENLLSYDMGGTTAKVCVVRHGQPAITTTFEVGGYRFKKGSGYPVRVSTIDLIEIGAGGGSIAHVEMGRLKVGPESAGADPGPACYGKGGEKPTVTDVDLVLGYLPEYLLGGEIPLQRALSIKAIEKFAAKPLGLSLTEAALGIYDIVNSSMALAMRAVSVERGLDPSTLTLVAFGGAGPVHASRLARLLRVKKILVPLAPGVFTTMGLLAADVKFDLVRTRVSKLEEVDLKVVGELYEEMEEEGMNVLKATGAIETEFVKSVDIRYAGQAYELNVPLPSEVLREMTVKPLEKAFIELYNKSYGYTTGDPIVTVNWRLLAVGKVPRPRLKAVTRVGKAEEAIKGKRKVYIKEYGDYLECNIYDRSKLLPEAIMEGPAIVEERTSTTVIPPKAKASIDKYSNIVIQLM